VIRRKSVFWKLLITYILIVFVSFIVFAIAFHLLFLNDLTNKHQSADRNQLNTVVQYIKNSYDNGWDSEIIISSLELSIAKQDKAFYLYDESGKFLYQIGDASFEVDREIVREVLREKQPNRKMSEEYDDQHIFIAASPIDIDASIEEKAIVMVSYGLERDFNQMKYLFVLASIISITITGLFTYYLSKRITAPLREMNRVALHIAKGQFDQRVKIKTRDELGELGETINYMAQELDGLDRMRKDFVANVSHDLRSPLTSIHGFVSAFLDETIPGERKRHYFTIMKEQTERMIKLVNDLLDMARIEAGQLEIRPVIFNLSELVRQVVARMEPEFVKKQVNVELISEEAQNIHVFADPDRIDQVIINLIQNAVQFSSPDSSVEVILKKEERAVISIRDYGSGIKQEDIQSIWERFYKADRARTKKAGTGLGLSIVKHILDLHQTDIQVESEVGRGTTFTFTLPIAQNKSKKHEKE
jgi:signal transduction histidine kinase